MGDSYLALLARGRARSIAVALCGAWLSFGMVGLAVFVAARRATGSGGLAGVAVAAFSLGSGALAPLRGRLVDRRGPRTWLPVLAAGYGAALLALGHAGPAGAGALVACAAAAGASAPPLVASLRALWASAVDESMLRRAYALTAVLGDAGLVAGPALAGALVAVAVSLPLAVCAAAALAAAVVARRAAPGAPPPRRGSAPTLLRAPGMRTLLAVEAALGVALGLVEVAVPDAAAGWGAIRVSGLLLGAFALGSVAGSVWFGGRSWRLPAARRYLIAAFVLAAALALPAAARGPASLGALLALAGLAYGPATISLFEALDAVAPDRPAEALTWVTTSGALGAAAGSAAAGWAVDGLGLWAAFAAASAVLASAAVAALSRRAPRPPRRRGGSSPRGRRR